MTFFQFLQIIGVVIALVTVGVGVWTFRRNAKVKRAEWLYILYQKFYENENLKSVKSDLVYHPGKFYVMNLPNEEISKNPEKMQFVEKVDDFLNFFEFIGSLHSIKQIKTEEVEMLFKYYLDKIKSNKHLSNYLVGDGYENLDKLLGVLVKSK
ncbi:MAG: hypothetical protein HY842_08425 [Bacteroidetes bacterium]|nr:hypothetical protein [Bacteroidota bacterium]